MGPAAPIEAGAVREPHIVLDERPLSPGIEAMGGQ
jgi:hypothetical protein